MVVMMTSFKRTYASMPGAHRHCQFQDTVKIPRSGRWPNSWKSPSEVKWSCSVVSGSLQPHGLYVAYQDSPSTGFSRQEYWSGLPFPSPGDLPNPGIEPRSPALEAGALTSEPPGTVTRRVPSAKSKRLDIPQDKSPLFLQQAHGTEEEREGELS